MMGIGGDLGLFPLFLSGAIIGGIGALSMITLPLYGFRNMYRIQHYRKQRKLAMSEKQDKESETLKED